MNFSKSILTKISLLLISNQILLNTQQVNSAENIKIIYSVFSRTIKVEELKTYAKKGSSTNKLRRILKATKSPDDKIRSILNRDFEIPITIASKLV